MSWVEKSIDEITEIVTKGTTPSTYGYDFIKEGVNFIRAEGISKDGMVDETTFLKISPDCHQKLKRSQLKSDDVLFSIAGMALGKTGIVKDSFLPANTNQAVAIVRPIKELINPKFLHFQFINPNFYELVNKFSAQSAQPNINLTQLKSLSILTPPMKIQKRIADILSAYDDLIENNLKRIKLLEQSAQNIYKEWFVNMRFPGHEETAMNSDTGLPEGWSRIPFSDVADFINGYAFKPKDHLKSGMPIIKIKELKNGVTAETPRNTGENIPQKYHFEDNTILFSWSASLDVYWWFGGASLLNQHLFKVVPGFEVNKWHFFYGLKGAIQEFRNRANGATMSHIKRSELNKVFYIKPEFDVAEKYEIIVRPILSQILTLSKQNEKLKSARDILLPRLMNQTIEV